MKGSPFAICLMMATAPLALAGGLVGRVGPRPTAPPLSGPVTLDRAEGMTPGQIQRLSEDQIDTLIVEANRSIQKFLDRTFIGPLPGPVWPSADYTLYYAAQISYDDWAFNNYIKTVSGPDLTSDGCSFPVATAYKKTFDANSCRHHDFAYRNLAQYYRTHTESVRKVADLRLFTDMNLQCVNDSTSRADLRTCNLAAVAAYAQARKVGANAFNSVQAHYSNP